MHTLPTKFHQMNGFIKKDGRYWMRTDRLAQHLDLTPNAISKIYHRHEDELKLFTCRDKMSHEGQIREVRLYDEQGCYIIAMHATGEMAKAFRQTLALFWSQFLRQTAAIGDMETRYYELRSEIARRQLQRYLEGNRGLSPAQFRRLVHLKEAGVLTAEELSAVFRLSRSRILSLYKLHREANGDFGNQQPKALRGGK